MRNVVQLTQAYNILLLFKYLFKCYKKNALFKVNPKFVISIHHLRKQILVQHNKIQFKIFWFLL